MARTGTRCRNLVAWLVAVLGIVALDQTCKSLMRDMLAAGPREFVPGVLRLLLVENRGAAFSVGEGASTLFAVVALGVVVASLAWIARDDEMPLALALGLACVCGGGVGNLVDRVAKGSVTDFLSTQFMSFPVFNVADIFITCGVVLTLVAWYVYDLGRNDGSGGSRDGR